MAIPFLTLAVGTQTAPQMEVTDFSSFTIDNNLDDGCTIQFDTRGYSSAAPFIDELMSDIWLYRGSNLFQRFRVASVEQSWDENGNDTVAVSGVCYRRLLQARHLPDDVTYAGVSQGAIVWDMIDRTQSEISGDLGITLGTTGPVVMRDAFYLKGQNIFDAITEYTKLADGIEWDIDENLELQIRQIATPPYTLHPQPIILGVNARRMSRPSSADRFANVAFVTGNTQTTTTVMAEAAGLSTDGRGRWETTSSINTANTQQQLIDLADGLVQTFMSPQSVWKVDMDPIRYFGDSEYQIGDYVTVVQPRSVVYTTGDPAPTFTGQVITRSITEQASGEISVSLSVIEVA